MNEFHHTEPVYEYCVRNGSRLLDTFLTREDAEEYLARRQENERWVAKRYVTEDPEPFRIERREVGPWEVLS